MAASLPKEKEISEILQQWFIFVSMNNSKVSVKLSAPCENASKQVSASAWKNEDHTLSLGLLGPTVSICKGRDRPSPRSGICQSSLNFHRNLIEALEKTTFFLPVSITTH